MARKLIDRKDILADYDRVIAPKYFPDDTLDKNRTGIYGFILESLAKSVEDTVILEQRRAADYCPELSNSEIRVMQTAKIRGVTVSYATPGQCFAMLSILKSDILNKGTRIANEIRFTIDRRSTILYHGINFSLEDDIIIRAVQNGTDYVYAVMYSGERASTTSYIQMFEQQNAAGQEMVAMVCRIYQYNYNIQDKIVTDDLEFLYNGMPYDYENKLAGFEVFYKQSSTDGYTLLNADHYLTRETTKKIFYNDDSSNVLYILNNPDLNIHVNAYIRVEIKETLGEEGSITIVEGDDMATFSLYRDAAYNYSGVNVIINMLSDVMGAKDGDDLSDIKAKLIDAKTRRDNVTTEHDIIQYINDIDANVQLVKKRNDIEDRAYYMYTLVRYGNNDIAPATTKPLILHGIQSDDDLGDFDYYEPTLNRKIIRAYNKFKINVSDEYPDYDTVTKVSINENEPDTYYVTCPYMILIDNNEISAYYFTSIDTDVVVGRKLTKDSFPYQIITQSVHIYRDSHNPDTYDQYTFTVTGNLNTANDEFLLNEDGELADLDCIRGYIIFNREGSPAAWLKLTIQSYDSKTREFVFSGSMKTNDFITDKDTLHIIEGIFTKGTNDNYNSVIDFTESQFQLYFTFKYDNSPGYYEKTDELYSLLPQSETTDFIMMNGYVNDKDNLCDLILEFNKFSRSPVIVTLEEAEGDTYLYTLKEVPFFEFKFGVECTHTLYETFLNMYTVYGNLLKQTTDFEVSLKFIATYGASKYITVTGGRTEEGDEITTDLNNLNPQFRFRAYGEELRTEELYQFIYEYIRDSYINNEGELFVSNICTAVENHFSNVTSIKYLGVDNFDASYQQFTYNQPDFINVDIITRYIPEQFNVTDIVIEIEET